MQQSDNINELAAALSDAQAELHNPTKNRTVKVKTDRGSYDFAYATLDVILDQVRPVLSSHGLSVVQVAHVEDGKAILETQIQHKSGQWMRGQMPIMANGGSGPQGLGSALTYAKRYALCAILSLQAEEDDDGNAAEGNHVERKANGTAKPAGNPPGITKFRQELTQFYREMRACSTLDEYHAFTATPEAKALIDKAQREFPKEWDGDGGDIAGMKGEMQKFVDELKAPPPSEGEQPHPIPVPDGKTDKERWGPWCKALLAKIEASPADEIDAWVKENAIPMDTLKIESTKTHAWLKEKIEAIRMGPVAA